eukprot:scaffold376_cov454-Pavlova_lutheri.AAC.14
MEEYFLLLRRSMYKCRHTVLKSNYQVYPLGHLSQGMTSMPHREEPPFFFMNKASDPRAVLTLSASGHRRSTQGVVSLSSIRVCSTSPSWVQVYTTAFLVLQKSRVEYEFQPPQPSIQV